MSGRVERCSRWYAAYAGWLKRGQGKVVAPECRRRDRLFCHDEVI